METRTYTITKKIAKHGNQSVIIVPTLLQEMLKPGTIVQVNLEIIDKSKIAKP